MVRSGVGAVASVRGSGGVCSGSPGCSLVWMTQLYYKWLGWYWVLVWSRGLRLCGYETVVQAGGKGRG